MTFEESLNLNDYIDRECGYTKKSYLWFICVINLIGSFQFGLMIYENKDMKVNTLGDKIFNFNTAYMQIY